MTRFILTLTFIALTIAPAWADPPIQTTARQAIVVDYDTGAVMLEKSADERMPTSSMSKVITMHVIFDALKNGRLKMDETLPVSEKAWRMQGSKMFVEVDKRVKVEDLVHGVIVQSGNDATIVLAEGLAGTEEAFADLLNKEAEKLGMKNSHFANASGWPDLNHYSTARDLAILAAATIRDYPEYYKYYGEKEFTYNNIHQPNRNPLLYKNIGADGIKTGHTEDGGYGLMGTGIMDGRRVIVVVNGLGDERERAEESAKLLEWGLKRFKNHKLFKAGETVADAYTVLGKNKTVPLAVKNDLVITAPGNDLSQVKITVHYKEPLIAPLQAGQEIGKLTIEIPDISTLEVPLYAGANIEPVGFLARALAKARFFLAGGDPESS